MRAEFCQQSLFYPDELIAADGLSLVKDVKPMELCGVIEHVLCLSFNLANNQVLLNRTILVWLLISVYNHYRLLVKDKSNYYSYF